MRASLWVSVVIIQLISSVASCTRFTSSNDTGKTLTFEHGCFDTGACEFIVGNSTSGQEIYALVNAYKGSSAIEFLDLTPETASVNELVITNTTTAGHVENTLYSKKVNHLALMNGKPVVAADSDPTHVFLVTDTDDGWLTLKNATVSEGSLVDDVKLQDLAPADPAEVSGLAASSWQIFAAITASGGSFGDQNSCIRALSKTSGNDALELDAVSKSVSNHAGASGVQDLVGDVEVDGLGDMCWDEQLERLLVGVNLASHTNHKISLMVARVDGSEVLLEGAIPLDLMDTTIDTTNSKIIGAGNVYVAYPFTMSHIRTMSTTTGGLYAVIQTDKGDIDSASRSRCIFAMPLVKTNDVASKIGMISVNHSGLGLSTSTTYTIFESAISDVDSSDEPLTYLWNGNEANFEEAAALVGGEPVPVSESDQITDIQLLDDTVFVSCRDDNADVGGDDTKLWRNQMGIFASTALFNDSGIIAGWTDWRHLYEIYDSVHSFGIDSTNEAFWMVHGEPPENVSYKEWGCLDCGVLCEIMPLIEEFLPSPDTSVFSIKVYPPYTNGIGNHRWVIATGYKRLLMVRTCGGYPRISNQDYKLFDSTTTPSFNQLGPIYCAEISHSDQENKGWIFAGGYGGFAVLSAPSGNGWDASTDLSDVDDLKENAGGEVSDFSFKTLSGISGPVYKIHADGTYIYVMTRDILYRIEMDAAKFRLSSPTALSATPIYVAQQSEYLLDMTAFENQARGFLATTSQLCWHNDWTTDGLSRGDWSAISSYTNVPLAVSFRPLNVAGTFGGEPVAADGTIGNLYISSNDTQNNCTNIHRYNIKGSLSGGNLSISSVSPINFGSVTDGLFSTTPHDLGIGMPVYSRRLWPYFDHNDLLATMQLGNLHAISDSEERFENKE